MKKEKCPLCNTVSKIIKEYDNEIYFSCINCGSIFLGKEFRLSSGSEKERYDNHNNDVNDPRYQNFVKPLVDIVLSEHSTDDKGLDYGCGPGPVITKLLEDNGFKMKIYDPFYAPFEENLEEKYDFIVLSEVAEHFYNPNKEFEILKNLLNEGGVLYIKTEVFDSNMNFADWYYKNDPTHVFFYREKTFEWIKERYSFSDLIITPDVIQLKL